MLTRSNVFKFDISKNTMFDHGIEIWNNLSP